MNHARIPNRWPWRSLRLMVKDYNHARNYGAPKWAAIRYGLKPDRKLVGDLFLIAVCSCLLYLLSIEIVAYR